MASLRAGGTPAVGEDSPDAMKNGGPLLVGIPAGARRGGKKGRGQQTAFEVASAAMKADFEAGPGDCMLMVVAVNGLRPQPPRLARSLEGYCVVVSHRAKIIPICGAGRMPGI